MKKKTANRYALLNQLFAMSMVVMLVMCISCSKDDIEPTSVKKDSVTGFVQKGPFIAGTNIAINELENDLSQTGKVFNTQITSNQGSFELHDIELVSNYISLKADGFYFNEIYGEQSASQITLFALSDVSDKSNLNVNPISHLEKARVEYLVKQGAAFSDAKIQAQGEVLDIFGFALTGNQSSELLDISKEGDDNGILLASSIILQGFRTEGQLTELLSFISNDLKEDGILSNTGLGSQLMNHAIYLEAASIRNNLEQRYADLGIDASIPDFEKYLTHFTDNADYEITESLIEFPENGMYGANILDLSKTHYSGSQYSLAANLAKGTKLKIKITALGTGIWYYESNSPRNWIITGFNHNTKTQTFTSLEPGEPCDLKMMFDSGDFLIEYFEMDASVPTRTKTITKTGI